MSIQVLLLWGFAFLTQFASAAPPPKNVNNDLCKEVDFIVDVLKLERATPFCSSFLDITTSTKTQLKSTTTIVPISTETTTTVDVVPTTEVISTTAYDTVITGTNTITSFTSTATQSVTSTSTVLVTVWTDSAPPPSKRFNRRNGHDDHDDQDKHNAPVFNDHDEHKAPVIPQYLTKYLSAEISTACNCLSLPTPTTTVTRTTTISAYTTSLTTATVTSTSTDFETTADIITVNTVTETTLDAITTVPGGTTVVTVTSTTTSYNVCATPVSFNCGANPPSGITYDPNAHSGEECCQACFSTPNCWSSIWDTAGDSPSCLLFTLTESAGPSTSTCPLGVQTLGLYCLGSGFSYNVPGPCMVEGPPQY